MRYTRYDMRRRRNGSIYYVIIILMILILAFIIGSIISKLFFTGTSPIKGGTDTIKSTTDSKESSSSKIETFTVIEIGVYEKKENADKVISALKVSGSPYVIEEDGRTKVYAGIYNDTATADAIIKSLSANNIQANRSLFTINEDDLCNAEICSILNGNIEILNKLSEKNVKAVETDKFKEWCSALKEPDKSSERIDVLNEIKKYVENMPKEITKDNTQDNYVFIYKTLQKLVPQKSK